jgi:dTMP kinase
MQNEESRKGILISFEGIDNSGKTTLAKYVVNYLRRRGVNVTFASELTTPVGEIIKKFFKERSNFSPLLKTLLFAADRTILVEDIILPVLARGDIVIVDRYYHSALAYRKAEGFDMEYVSLVNRVFPRPDAVILIDVTPEESKRRGLLSGKFSPYSYEFLSMVRRNYLEMAHTEDFIVIDGMKDIKKVKAKVIRVVRELLPKLE